MNVLLLSMPDSFEHMPTVAIRMPNGALSSLAGNIDAHHRVSIGDLVLVQSRVAETVKQLVHELEPDLVGLSVMTFQRTTAFKIARLIRRVRPSARIVAGGYDPSLAPDAYAGEDEFDFLIRGEGERTLRELLRALERQADVSGIAGLSYREGAVLRHNPERAITQLASDPIELPNRGARVLDGYTLIGRKVDVVETSRGCTYDCSFCSIIEMLGRNFHTFSIERVLADISDARRRGAEAIFLVDDNITLDIHRFEALCHAIIESGLQNIEYFVQAMTAPLAQHGATLAPLMRRAGFRYVFLGIENVLDEDLAFLKARAKNAKRQNGRTVGNATIDAINHLRRNGMYVVGGLIVGNPDDTRDSIEANLAFARRYVDWPYIQHPTPYPRTPMTKDFVAQNLVVNTNVEEYDGTTAVVKSRFVDAEEIEFLRWRAERWMKVKHFPIALWHDPLYVARHARVMFGHTFRGCTWRTMLGLESEREAFRRYRLLRKQERDYLPELPLELQMPPTPPAIRVQAA